MDEALERPADRRANPAEQRQIRRDEDRQRQKEDAYVEIPEHAQRHGGIGCFQSERRQELSRESDGAGGACVLSTRASKGTCFEDFVTTL